MLLVLRSSRIAVALGALGCAEAAPPSASCERSEALFGGSPESTLAFELDPRRSIIALVSQSEAGDRGLCSGIVVGDDWILTAAHCLPRAGVVQVVAPGSVRAALDGAPGCGQSAAAFVGIPVGQGIVHESRDLALLRLADAAPSAAVVLGGLQAMAVDEVGAKPGDRGEVAGYGLTRDGDVGELGFLPVKVERATAERFSVSAEAGGSCFGDSGGPLLLPGSASAPLAAGILSGGSASCTGVDHYTALNGFTQWFERSRASLTTRAP